MSSESQGRWPRPESGWSNGTADGSRDLGPRVRCSWSLWTQIARRVSQECWCWGSSTFPRDNSRREGRDMELMWSRETGRTTWLGYCYNESMFPWESKYFVTKPVRCRNALSSHNLITWLVIPSQPGVLTRLTCHLTGTDPHGALGGPSADLCRSLPYPAAVFMGIGEVWERCELLLEMCSQHLCLCPRCEGAARRV